MSEEKGLSAAELARKEKFEAREKILLEKGYQKEELLISAAKANFLGIALAAIPTIPFICIYVLRGGSPNVFGHGSPLVLFGVLALLIVQICVHEFIHGLFWSFGAENGWKDIAFGFQVKSLTPYCTCASPLKKSAYILGTSMPMILLGLVFLVLSDIFLQPQVFLLGVLGFIGGGGDLLVILKVLFHKAETKDVLYQDHPYKIGLVAYKR